MMMKVIDLVRPGGPEALFLGERPLPQPGAGEVRIRVAASGVNRPDVLQRRGLYPAPPGASDILGLEVSGVIDAGDQTAMAAVGLQLGDPVCALVAGGGYAQFCVAPAVQCLPVPRGWSLLQAAALPETVFTVWHNVFERGALQAGETLLVHGGSSGIGVTAIQLAKARGARVVVTAGSDEKCRVCRDLGADLAINYRTHDFVAVLHEWAGPGSVDVILDMVAGNYVARELPCLAPDGRLVVIAVQGGVDAHVDASLLMRQRLTITGSTLRSRSVEFKGRVAKACALQVWPLLESGVIKPVIDRVFPALDAAAANGSGAVAAHGLMDGHQHVGKLILDWSTT